MSLFIMDAHCDTLMEIVEGRRRLGERDKGGQLDIPRMLDAGISAQIFAIFVPNEYLPGAGARRALQYVDAFYREAEENSGVFAFARSASDARRAAADKKIAGFLSIEGGEALDGSIEMLRIFHRLGVRLMTLTWSRRNEIADGAYEERTGSGLTRFGVQVVEEMDRLGMVVDVSHISESGFWDVLRVCKHPVIASHSNSKALCPHPRNLADEQAKAIAERGGVIGVTFVGKFLGEDRRTIAGVVDHIDYLASLVGPEHIAIGSDFDGVSDEELPRGLHDVAQTPALAAELARRGYSEAKIKGIMGGNLLRVIESVIG